jgi:hypothetical protein
MCLVQYIDIRPYCNDLPLDWQDSDPGVLSSLRLVTVRSCGALDTPGPTKIYRAGLVVLLKELVMGLWSSETLYASRENPRLATIFHFEEKYTYFPPEPLRLWPAEYAWKHPSPDLLERFEIDKPKTWVETLHEIDEGTDPAIYIIKEVVSTTVLEDRRRASAVLNLT